MTSPLDGPKIGSRAYAALKKLYDLGGQADLQAWMNATGYTTTVNTFHAEIVSKLTTRMKIFAREGGYVISDDGLLHIGVSPDAPRSANRGLVAPRYVGPQRELEDRHKVRLQDMREGSFDYRAIPSLHGSTRVEHKTSLTVIGGVKQG